MTTPDSSSNLPDARPPIVLVGPTATGKTAAALALALEIGGEIISADSMQVYRDMDIGTAKPDARQRALVPFHLLDVAAPDQPFTVADWKIRAEAALADIAAREKWPLICGGTGLYVRALLDGWTLAATPASLEVRAELQAEMDAHGLETLRERLREADPAAAARLHPNDAVRILRALEVFRVSGRPISQWQAEDRLSRQPRPAFRFGLTLPRPELNARIETRVDAMLAQGLEAEARGLLAQGYKPALGPLRSLGYKEIVAYLRGEMDLPTAIQDIKQNTRRYAKRQQTWFRADPGLAWLDVSELSSATVAAQLLARLQSQAAFRVVMP